MGLTLTGAAARVGKGWRQFNGVEAGEPSQVHSQWQWGCTAPPRGPGAARRAPRGAARMAARPRADLMIFVEFEGHCHCAET